MPDFVKLSHNGASDAQASVYLWVGVAIGVYVRAQVGKPGYGLYCLIVNMDCSWSNSSSSVSVAPSLIKDNLAIPVSLTTV